MISLRTLVATTFPAVLLLLVAASRPMADPPPGDTCASPISVPFGYYWAYSGDLAPYANDYDPGVPGPSCTGLPAPGKDAVFAIDVHCGEGLNVSMEPTGFDGALYIVTDCADPASTCVSGSDEEGAGAFEIAGMDVFTSQTYYVIVDARDAGAGGAFNISFDISFWDIPPGACCFPDGHCEIIHIDFCSEAGGITQGPCVPCDPNPCVPTPVLEQTWGAIRARYR